MASALDALEVPVADHVGTDQPARSAAARAITSRGGSGRGSEPAPESARLLEQPEPDQVVFDAEFVALMLTEYPPADGEGTPAPVPPRAATRTRRVESRSPAPTDRGGRPRPARTSNPRGGRRRLRPWPRSPPGP